MLRNGNRAPVRNRRRGDVHHDDPAVNVENDAINAHRCEVGRCFAGQDKMTRGRQASGTVVWHVSGHAGFELVLPGASSFREVWNYRMNRQRSTFEKKNISAGNQRHFTTSIIFALKIQQQFAERHNMKRLHFNAERLLTSL